MKFITDLHAKVSGFVNEQRSGCLKRSLESDIAAIISIVEGHKAAGLPSGHLYYQELWLKVCAKITEYQAACAQINVEFCTRDQIMATVPPLRELSNLADGVQPVNPIFPIGIAVVMGGAVLTILLAAYHDLYLALTWFANVRYHG